jgi:hypothetical protein
MDEDTIANAEVYSARHRLCLLERLGTGIHGIVFAVESNVEFGPAALKVHYSREPYLRERRVYERLEELGVSERREISARNGIDPVGVQNRLKVCPFEAHDGIPAASQFVEGNATLTHIAVQSARGNVEKFRCLALVEQSIAVIFRILHG